MAQEESSGGTFVAALTAEPDQLDPHVTSVFTSFQVLENVFDTLVQPDEELVMQPALAESWEISDDGLTVTFKLREGVTFHDGSPLTAADVVYSYGRIRESASNGWRFGTVTDVSAPDDSTVVFTLSAPTPNLLSHIGAFKGMSIVQQANVESGEITTAPVGTGPFSVAEWNSGDSIELVRNDDYWAGAPSLDGVTFRFIPDSTVALTSVQTGDVHWTDNLPAQQVNNLMDAADIVVEAVPSFDYWYFAPNQNKPPFDDVRVRQAIAYGIDRDAIVQATHFGNAVVNQTAIPATSGWYFDYSPYSYDVEQAKALLEEAGVSDLQLEFMVVNSEAEAITAAQVMAATLAEVGIDATIRQLDSATWVDEQSAGNFDVSMWSWIGNLDPSDFYYAQHYSTGNFNAQGYNNPETDRLLDEAGAETDPDARKALYDQAAKQIVDDASYVYLYNPPVVQGYSPSVEGYMVRSDAALRLEGVSLTE